MSWFSDGLAHIGISKDVQRQATGFAGAALAPVTGGLSTLLTSSVNAAKRQASGVLQNAVDDVNARISGATRVVNAADTGASLSASFAQLSGNPLVIGALLIALALILTRNKS